VFSTKGVSFSLFLPSFFTEASHSIQVLKKLHEFRNWLLEYSYDPQNRLPFRRNGKPAIKGKGMLTLKAREEILKKLQELEKHTKMQILSPEEIEEIKRIWEEDKKRFF